VVGELQTVLADQHGQAPLNPMQEHVKSLPCLGGSAHLEPPFAFFGYPRRLKKLLAQLKAGSSTRSRAATLSS